MFHSLLIYAVLFLKHVTVFCVCGSVSRLSVFSSSLQFVSAPVFILPSSDSFRKKFGFRKFILGNHIGFVHLLKVNIFTISTFLSCEYCIFLHLFVYSLIFVNIWAFLHTGYSRLYFFKVPTKNVCSM